LVLSGRNGIPLQPQSMQPRKRVSLTVSNPLHLDMDSARPAF
jgi:hypothetical protein